MSCEYLNIALFGIWVITQPNIFVVLFYESQLCNKRKVINMCNYCNTMNDSIYNISHK
jgi:hypothetical protein